MIELMDEDGENLAVRYFLMLYGNSSVTVADMKEHLDATGYPLWPTWVEGPGAQGHLTKGGAQDWLRFLFSLEIGR